MSSPFDKKSIYHSGLVKESPITAVITCDGPQKSQYKDKPPYISLKIDEHEHYLEVENDDIGEAFSNLKGETVEITATGRGSDAFVEVTIVGGSQPPRQQQRQPAQRQERQAAPAQRQPDSRHEPADPDAKETPEEKAARERKAFVRAALFATKCGVLMQIAYKVADNVFAATHSVSPWDKVLVSSEDRRALATTIFIEIKSQTDINKLPAHFIDLKATTERKPEPKQEPPPPPPPPQRQPPDDDAELDDIPF